MKKIYAYMFVLFLIFTILGCTDNQEDEEINSCQTIVGKTKIMPLGASRVQGARPFFESFRYELWKDLLDANWEVDFVGTQKDKSLYIAYNNYCFDNDHEGRSGWTSTQINNNIQNWLDQNETPDVVLFSSPGGNDALQGVDIEEILPNINAIIDKIQAHNPDVTILIEKMAPGKSTFMTPELHAAFDNMKSKIDEIAIAKTSSTSKVVAVDMATGFTDEFLADNVHYNSAGADFIAARYYEKLLPFLKK